MLERQGNFNVLFFLINGIFKPKGLQVLEVIEPIKFKGAVIIEVKPKVFVSKPLKNSPAFEVASSVLSSFI